MQLFTLLDLCVSSLRRGHANRLCIVPMLIPEGNPLKSDQHALDRPSKDSSRLSNRSADAGPEVVSTSHVARLQSADRRDADKVGVALPTGLMYTGGARCYMAHDLQRLRCRCLCASGPPPQSSKFCGQATETKGRRAVRRARQSETHPVRALAAAAKSTPSQLLKATHSYSSYIHNYKQLFSLSLSLSLSLSIHIYIYSC